MGRHRRSTPAPDPLPGTGSGHRGTRRKPGTTAVRTGLIGVSAAVAMGAVAGASGLIPGPATTVGAPDGNDDRLRADGPGEVTPAPTSGPTRLPDRDSSGASRDENRGTPSAAPTRTPTTAPTEADPTPTRTDRSDGEKDGGKKKTPEPGGTAGKDGKDRSSAPAGEQTRSAPAAQPSTRETAAEDEVLSLVNIERAQAGCRPVQADAELADLAGDFSEDMAERGFFAHDTPDGKSPWDRAEDRGIDGLGGENIALGQADARAVMDSWMNSPGHRANILNCDYRTLGVGAHFAEGGPWWTQEFGF